MSAILNIPVVLELRRDYASGRCNQAELAHELDVDRNVIWCALHGRTWKDAAIADGLQDQIDRRIAIGRRGAHNPSARFTDESVVTIILEHAAGKSIVALANEYHVSRRAIGDVVQRKSWRHVKSPLSKRNGRVAA